MKKTLFKVCLTELCFIAVILVCIKVSGFHRVGWWQHLASLVILLVVGYLLYNIFKDDEYTDYGKTGDS